MIVTIKIKVKLKIKMINKNENENENENVNDNLSSILWRHFNQLKHKQKHLSNIQQDIKKKKKIKDCPKHPSNFHPDNTQNFYLENTPRSIKSKFYLHTLHLKKDT